MGERCKFPQRGLVQSPGGNRIFPILALKSDIWWHQFTNFSENQSATVYAKFEDLTAIWGPAKFGGLAPGPAWNRH